MMDLLDLRNQLDVIDADIVQLYEKRMDICKQVAEYKISTGKKVFDKQREMEKLATVKAMTHNEFNAYGIQELFEQIMRIDEKDVLIGMSFPRYSRQTVLALQYARSRGASVVAITDCASSPLTQYSDCNLFAKSDMASFVDSLVAPLSLINALIVAVSARNKDVVTRNFERLEEIWREYEVYEEAKPDSQG